MSGLSRSLFVSVVGHGALLATLGIALGQPLARHALEIRLELAPEEAVAAETATLDPREAAPAEESPFTAEEAADTQLDSLAREGELEFARAEFEAELTSAIAAPAPQEPVGEREPLRLREDMALLAAVRAGASEVRPVPAAPTIEPVAAIVALPGHNPPPVYPALARKRGWAGLVTLVVEVGADGTVTDVQVALGSGHAVLDDAARQAVLGWRFSGGPGSSEVKIRFVVEARS